MPSVEKGLIFNTGPYMHSKNWPIELCSKNWPVKKKGQNFYYVFCLSLSEMSEHFFNRATHFMNLGLLVAEKNMDRQTDKIHVL